MPIRPCTEGGKPGYRWGKQHCYTYPAGDQRARKRAKQRAYIQGHAATHGTGHGAKAFDETWVMDPDFWAAMRAVLLPRISRIFRESFIVGAEQGAMTRPAVDRVAAGERALVGVGVGTRQLDPSQETVLPFDLEAINNAADDVIANYTDDWWEQFSSSTRRQMRRIFQRANALGLTNAEVARELEPLFGAMRAQRIAVSELTNLLGQGAQETYRQAGYGQWEWRTVRDSKVDPICQDLDGKRFPMSRKFTRAHVSCRCFPVAAGQPTARRAQNAVPPELPPPYVAKYSVEQQNNALTTWVMDGWTESNQFVDDAILSRGTRQPRLYRGLTMTDEQLAQIKSEPFDLVSSSFSLDRQAAETFAAVPEPVTGYVPTAFESAAARKPVIFETQPGATGLPVKGNVPDSLLDYYDWQQEVVVKGQFRVVGTREERVTREALFEFDAEEGIDMLATIVTLEPL